MRVDRQYLGPASHKQHLRIAAMADELAAVEKPGERDTLLQIQTDRPCVIVSHCHPAWTSETFALRTGARTLLANDHLHLAAGR
jgi:hypothetical protein